VIITGKMTKLKKCVHCNVYTLKENCPRRKKETSEAHYKFIKIRDASTDSKTR